MSHIDGVQTQTGIRYIKRLPMSSVVLPPLFTFSTARITTHDIWRQVQEQDDTSFGHELIWPPEPHVELRNYQLDAKPKNSLLNRRRARSLAPMFTAT